MSTESILIPPAEMDSAWKNVLDAYFQEFMTFFYPVLAEVIDWSIPYDVMDKELQAITKDAMVGKQFVDKLIKVKSKDGQAHFVLVHLEVQGEPQTYFPLRLYQYNYRIFDRYQLPVITLAYWWIAIKIGDLPIIAVQCGVKKSYGLIFSPRN